MIIISKKAQEILQWYKDTFVDYKTPQEYGRSAFWLWYNQVSNEIRNLDYRTIPYGYSQIAPMEYWGDIVYSKISIVGTTVIVVEDFSFDIDKFTDWLHHIARNYPPYSVSDTSYGFSSVLYDSTQKSGIIKLDGSKLVEPIFDDIINFHHSTDDYNTIHAIGFIGDRVYSISMNGDVTLLHMSKQDYLNKKHLYDEIRKRKIAHIISEVISQYLKQNLILN